MLCDQPVDYHVPGLSDPVAPVLRLFVHRRVPVRVVEDHVAGSGQVQPDPSRTRAAYEAQHPGVVVEPLNDRLPELGLGVSVEPHVVEFEHVQHLLENVQHPGHLREYQGLLPPVLYGPQQENHLYQFPTVIQDDILVREVQQETRPDALDFPGDHLLHLLTQVVQSVVLGHDLRIHRKGSQGCRPGHHLGHHKGELIENRLELVYPVIHVLSHEVRGVSRLDPELVEIESIDPELLSF